MINNAIPQTESSVSASVPNRAILRNSFLAVKNDVPVRAPDAELLSACTSRRDFLPPSEQVLRVAGYEEMTAANCNQFRKAACAAWNEHTDVEIDLSQTTLIDCAGLGALIAVRNLTRERKGVARLMNPTSCVRQMLDLTRTGQLFDIINAADDGLIFGPAAHN